MSLRIDELIDQKKQEKNEFRLPSLDEELEKESDDLEDENEEEDQYSMISVVQVFKFFKKEMLRMKK